MTSMFDLSGRSALVTGGNTGIGRALVLALGAHGADVAIHHLGDIQAADSVAAELHAMGRRAERFEQDLGEKGAAGQLAEDVLSRFGAIDILVANAAVERRRPWTGLSDDDLDHHVDVNLRSLLQLFQNFVPPMETRGWGRIVAVGSVLQNRPRAETVIYTALKAAQINMIRAIGRNVGGQGVTMNVISPGTVLTQRSQDLFADPAVRTQVVSKIPLARIGEPEDLTGPLVMLCSDAGRYITGIDLLVDGGWSIGDPVRTPEGEPLS